MKKSLFISVIFMGLAGCSTTPAPRPNTPEAEPDRVISRIDDLKERPQWLTESEPFKIENGSVISLGSTTIPGDNRVEAAYRIAENNAKASIAGAIEQRLDFIFQNAEEGTAMSSTQARFIGAEASKLVTSSIRPGKRYWEKVASTSDTGQRTTTFKVFSTVSMPESEFKQAVMEAIKKARGQGGISADFAKKVDAHWDQFTSAK